MDISNVETFGLDAAIRGMRNSYASWDKSDSHFRHAMQVGDNDLKLMRSLYKAGGSERKFMRMIQVWCDIKAPLYWWKQFDTYKVGTTALSTSTMHSILNLPITEYDFEFDEADEDFSNYIYYIDALRKQANDANDPRDKEEYFEKIIALLPESYLQTRTINMNYEVVAHIIEDRHAHKLYEWRHDFCPVMLIELPYLKEIIGYDLSSSGTATKMASEGTSEK